MEKRYVKSLAAMCAATTLMIFFAACTTSKEAEELAALKKEVQMLKDKSDIQDVLWRYGLRFDLDRRDEWFKLFAQDCQFSTDRPGKLVVLNGFDEIKSFYSQQTTTASGQEESAEQQTSQAAGGKESTAQQPVKVSTGKEGAGQQTTQASSGVNLSGHIDLAGVVKIDGDNAVAVGFQVGSGIRTWKLRRTNGEWLISATASRMLDNKERCREVVPENW